MKFLYVTDLHGHRGKYQQTLETARRHAVSVVINGGDMLPKECDPYQKGQTLFDVQEDFLREWWNSHLVEYDQAGIHYLSALGNDDLGFCDGLFEEICGSHPRAANLAQKSVKVGGYEFIGMNWVADYPFRLKDRCRFDRPEAVLGEQFGSGLYSTPERRFREIKNWPTLVKTLPTLQEELGKLPVPADSSKAVYVVHMPPAGLGMDICGDRNHSRVGSRAVHDFIRQAQPLLTLHGHIHESPLMPGGQWRAKIGKTLCLQPGQMPGKLTCVLGDLQSLGRVVRLELDEVPT